MSLKCFLLKETDSVREWLRRYTSSTKPGAKCPGRYSYHNAQFLIGDTQQHKSKRTEEPAHTDPRWPKKCEFCDYLFPEDDRWQVFSLHLYIAPDGLTTLPDAAPGAMWYAPWWGTECGSPHFKALPLEVRSRGHLVVKLPGNHEWDMDQKASNGDGWTRTGEPPNVTARPSILVPDYHGFLTAGELIPV